MNQALRSTVTLFMCFFMVLNGSGKVAARGAEYIQLSDTLEVRRELFDITSPVELSVYRVRYVEDDIDFVVQYFQLQGGEKINNPPYKYYIRNGHILLMMESGSVYLSLDGASGDKILNLYTHPGYSGPMVWPEELPDWQNELPYMSRAEAAQRVQEALNDLYALEAFEQQIEVYTVASSGSEQDCYLVDVGFRLNGVPITNNSRILFSGWDSWGMHVNAIVDEQDIRVLTSGGRIYSVDKAGEAEPVLDFDAAMEIYQRSYGDLLINDRIRVQQAQLLYIPMPVQGRQNIGKMELRPVWCFQYTYVNNTGWQRSSYIDAITGVEYDM